MFNRLFHQHGEVFGVSTESSGDYAFFRPRVRKLEDEGHDSSDWKAACEKALMWGETIYIGRFLQLLGKPTLHDQEPVLESGVPMARRPIGVSTEQAKRIFARMM